MGTLMVMLSAAMWGLSGVCGQFLFENYHPYPVWLIAVRQVAAGILFLLFMRIKGEPLLALWRSGRKNITEILWFTLGLLGAQFMYYYTISVSNAPTSTILQYQAPIFIILWQAFVRRRMPEGREMLGVVLAMTGVFLISTHGDPSHLVISPVALASGELSAIALCIYMIAPENILKQFPTMLIMGWGQLIASLFLLPFCNLADSGVSVWTPAAAGAVGLDVGMECLALPAQHRRGKAVEAAVRASRVDVEGEVAVFLRRAPGLIDRFQVRSSFVRRLISSSR